MKTVTVLLTGVDNPDNVDLEWVVDHLPKRDAHDHIGRVWQCDPADAVMSTILRQRDAAGKLVDHVNVRIAQDLWDAVRLRSFRDIVGQLGKPLVMHTLIDAVIKADKT